MANCAHQVLGEDWTAVLRKLDALELGHHPQIVEHSSDTDRPQDAVNRSVSFRPPSAVHLQVSPSTSQVESPLAAYTNRR